jgi:hypothetical protein
MKSVLRWTVGIGGFLLALTIGTGIVLAVKWAMRW